MAGAAPRFVETIKIAENVFFERNPKFKNKEDKVINALREVCVAFTKKFGPIKNEVIVQILDPSLFLKAEEKIRKGIATSTIYTDGFVVADVGYAKGKYFVRIRIDEGLTDEDYLLSCAYGLVNAAFMQKGKHGWIPSVLVTTVRKAVPALPSVGKRLMSDYPYIGAVELLASEVVESIVPGYVYPRDSSYYHAVELMSYIRNKVGDDVFLKSLKSGDFSLIPAEFCKRYKVKESAFYAAINNVIPGIALSELQRLLGEW